MRLRLSYVATIGALSLLLAGCGSNDGSSSTPVQPKIALNVPTEANVSNGVTDVISVTQKVNTSLSLTTAPKATDIKLNFVNQSDASNFNVKYSPSCYALGQAGTCEIYVRPNPNAILSLSDIDATISGSNTDSYPIGLDQQMLAVSASNHVISSGSNATLTITNNLNSTIYNLEPKITGSNVSYHNNCGLSFAPGQSCQVNLSAANSAQNENLSFIINGVDYTNQIGGLSVVRPELSLSTNEVNPKTNKPINLIKPNSKLAITLSNNTNAQANGIGINPSNIDQLIQGMSLANTTCTSTLDPNSQCVINLKADKAVKPSIATLTIPQGNNFNSVSTNIAAENIQSTLSTKSLNVSSNTQKQFKITVNNDTNKTLSNLYWSILPGNINSITEDDQKTTCQSSLAVGQSCQYTLDYTPGEINQYNEILTSVEVDASNGFFSENPLTIRNFPGFYSVPIDLHKHTQEMAYNDISDAL